MSKKIVSKFFQNSLFTRLAITDWEGQIEKWGDAVMMVDFTVVTANHVIDIPGERDPEIFKDVALVNLIAEDKAAVLQAEVEAVILSADDDSMSRYSKQENISPHNVHGRLYFVAAVVPVKGLEPKGYGMKFVYGFKIG